MGTEVRPPDLTLWACTYARQLLIARTPMEGWDDWDLADVEVSNKEPISDPWPAAAIVVRDDGGPRKSTVSWTRSLGVSVLAGSRTFDAPAIDLARLLMGALSDESLPLLAGPGCPVASVDDSNGPYQVPEVQDRTRMYFTVEYTVVGAPVS